MVTNRKKIKNKKRKIRLLVGFFTTILIIGGFLGYVIYQIFLAHSSYISPLAKGTYASTSEDIAVLVENKLKENKIEYLSVSQIENGYIIVLKDGGEVRISSHKDLNKQISSLQFILSRLTMDGKTIVRLDLMFDKPIVVFK